MGYPGSAYTKDRSLIRERGKEIGDRRGEDIETQRGESGVKMEGETGVMLPQAKELQGISQGMPPEARRGRGQILLQSLQKECGPANTFGLLASRTVKEYISVVLSHQGYGNSLRQP